VAQKRSAKKSKTTSFDIEAVGLLLIAVGIALLGFLLPILPTGDLGINLRTLFMTNSIGYGAYALPWPFLILGSLFMMRRNPKSWPRVLLGYTLVMAGGWCLLMLIQPEVSGQWGQNLRQALTGAAGVLSYLPALFVASVGLDLIAGKPPTNLTRGVVRSVAASIRRAFKGFMATRKRLKEQAAFSADVALAQTALRELDRDLEALSQLYPGSAEISKWRKAIASSQKALKTPTSELLEDTRHDLKAWQTAVTGFSKDRATELSVHLTTEGVSDFDSWTRTIKAQLDDSLPEGTAVGRALDALRKALVLDLTALTERHRKLMRERDLDQTSLKGAKPQTLLKIHDKHHKRLNTFQHIADDAAHLEELAGVLESWRTLSSDYAVLSQVFPDHEELADYGQTLAKELREKGRKVLADLAGWQQALQSVETRMREEASANVSDIESTWETPEDEPDFGSLNDHLETPLGELASLATELHTMTPTAIDDTYEDETVSYQDDPPAIGGIPIQVPSVELLDPLEAHHEDPTQVALEVKQRVAKIDETLANFGLQGRVVSSVRGPTVTRFEVEPAPGEKISRFANLSDDLALAMAVGSVRIEAPIPGKSVIGLEVPNANRDLIRFREAVDAPSFRRTRARLPMILGKSIDSEMVVGDLAKMPHLLIAGSTGSGKSVAVNTLIGSLLYKFLPTELRFLMIDPKMVELTPYDGIPHLLRPVVTNPNDAAGVLLGAVAHMERRYKMMSKIGAKNLDQYNEKALNLDLPQLPFITIIIDELADLMITSPKEVESAIMRLAQMARATGMHLILATQRPSVDILTSLIKVNVPARMAFAVSSGHDSRTILDSMGAERLIGMGDMLYYQPGMVKPTRYQGPFITENEIMNLANFLRRQYFDDEFVEAYGNDFDPPSLHESDASGLVDWNDDKLREAAELVINEGQASVSRLQRRLSVGHARAGKLMDSLESLGVVGPHVGSKPREVLVDMEELPNIFGK
jgi:S-DNA-T family DNA segregation ATPase FtsK/SpoIIIE